MFGLTAETAIKRRGREDSESQNIYNECGGGVGSLSPTSSSSSLCATHARSRTHIKGLLAALLNEMDIGRSGQMGNGCHRLLNALSPLPFSDRPALSGQETAKDGGEQRKNEQTDLGISARKLTYSESSKTTMIGNEEEAARSEDLLLPTCDGACLPPR